jgi:DNA-binding NarL/FixJ family response regulator
MPDIDGLTGLSQIRALYPDQHVAILSGTSDPASVRKALNSGAVGWVPKTMSGEPLIHAIRLMAMGQKFFSPELLDDNPTNGLSDREAQVAQLLALGLSDKQIADRLVIQLGTVKVHVKRVLKKSSAPNRTKFALMYQGR